MSVSEVLDKYIQKQITAGNDDFAYRLAENINYNLLGNESEEKGKTQWEDARKKWDEQRDKDLGCENRKSRDNSELEETEAQKNKEHTTIKEASKDNNVISSTLNTMIQKYALLDATKKPYQEIFNGRVQNNWEDMLGRWNKYVGADYGVSRAPKKNPCPEDEFINLPVEASKDFRTMLKKYAQVDLSNYDDNQIGDFDTQIHPEEDPQADRYEQELNDVNIVENLFQQYEHHYHSPQSKSAFKDGLLIGTRGH